MLRKRDWEKFGLQSNAKNVAFGNPREPITVPSAEDAF